MKCRSCKREIPNNSIFCNWCGAKQLKPAKKEITVPKPRHLPSGSWFIQPQLGGESIPVTEDTEALCKAKAIAIKAGFVEQRKKPSALTLGKAIDKYIEDLSNTLSPSTIRGYKTIRNNYMQSVMDKPITDITDWQAICDAEAKDRAPKTVKNTWRLVSTVLSKNGVQPPKVATPLIVPNERPWLDAEQIPVFVSAVKGTPVCVPALLALHSLRRSEIMALKWDCVDLKNGTIKVAAAAVMNDKQKLTQKTATKNATSKRVIPIMIPELTDALSVCEDKTGLVVTCNPNTIWAQVNRVCKANHLPAVGVHGLRHSFASLGHHLGMSEQEVMEIGGWADTKVMHKIYTHLAAADRAKAENKMAAFYKKPVSGKAENAHNANEIANNSK